MVHSSLRLTHWVFHYGGCATGQREEHQVRRTTCRDVVKEVGRVVYVVRDEVEELRLLNRLKEDMDPPQRHKEGDRRTG